MKNVALTVLLLLGTTISRAQQATDADLNAKATERKTESSVPPAPNLPERSQIDEIFRQTSLGKEADERRLHLQWRELANQVGNEPRIIEARNYAERAPTDLEKRQRLRDYYEFYYDRMRALASSSEMKTALDELKRAHVSLTAQRRVRPETDASLPTPTPGKSKKANKKHSWERAADGG